MDYSAATVIIPTLNEAANIGTLLDELAKRYPGLQVIVADDDSSDGTQAVAAAKGREHDGTLAVRVLDRKGLAPGITASVLDALPLVTTEYFAVMDGDLQHPPAVLGELLAKLAAGADVAAAARRPYQENQGWHRIAVTRLATFCARFFLRRRGLQVADPMSGFFAARTTLVKERLVGREDRFERAGYKIFFDLLRVLGPAVRIEQIFYQFAFRSGGCSKLRPAHAFYFLRSLLR